jgi:uncharacterized protein (DUF1330 family)
VEHEAHVAHSAAPFETDSPETTRMPKAYWVSCYRSVRDPEAYKRYAQLSGPAIEAHGGRFLARATAAKWYEAGLPQRLVIVEFDSLGAAVAAHESPAYQEALAVLGTAAERDLRFVEGE